MNKHKPTTEQEAIIEAFLDGKDIRVQAGAGTGKSSTLMMLAKEKIEDSGTYLAYNKAIQQDAAARFPFNTECVTSHSLAYRAVGSTYKHRLNGPRLATRATAEILGLTQTVQIGEHPPLGPFVLSRMVSDAVRRFTYSADATFHWSHVAPVLGYSDSDMAELCAYVLPAARRAWKDITDPDGRLFFTHDHYMKIWSLSKPVIHDDFLFLDESQDANPALTSVVEAQTHLQRVSVGDDCQAIYGWRGASNALQSLPGTELTLSRSFRFGESIASEANVWLDTLDAPIRLTGADSIESTVTSDLPWAGTVLCRTNGGVMGEAMQAMDECHKVAVVGGGKQIADLARACLDLQDGGTTTHPELLAFKSWADVVEYSEERDGADLKPMVDLVNRYTPKTVLYATNRLVEERDATRIVSTAHKAKGREWPAVRIGDDFHREPDPETGLIEVERAEAMLCYVSVTRARNELDCGALDWFKYGNVVIA